MTRSGGVIESRKQLASLLETATVRITLAVLFLVPLIFPIGQPNHPFVELKAFVLHVGMLLAASLWLWEGAIRLRLQRQPGKTNERVSPLGWLGWSPSRWAVVALSAMWLAQIVSTILSPLPEISFYGGNENFAGGNLYDAAALLIVFLVVAFKFRSVERLEQLAWVLIVSATIAAAYGVAQHFGWDPLGGRTGIRVPSSFGNTINFSAYVAMAIPATIVMPFIFKRTGRVFQLSAGLALAVQMAGMLFSESQGPYVGVLVALLALLAGIAL
ncbi:hypothetical protein [Candidatus Lucifugimonas marina]|uniref:Uncharacterized protein n=1 Tax=Candidatus Lucifugimonas marina TaxID=3038979 RepID=A0AAJ6CUL4_9CHLR|nr:hypothetical protein [SAR202 cluster bacterium JH702]MDG0868290.1 hypothetical protein [SAR202 cluster bacterium JH639]WFG34934.1 hypothetical protein GKN94_04270 [SAR202 cluster bacterium JH545]WFG38885.1 hypothetical protein GKO48_04405 [SAR202 cluster bacterium JH1073]